MKTRLASSLLAALACAAVSPHAFAGASPNAITYQGQLQDAGMDVDGPVDFIFRLYGVETGGSQLGATVATTENLVDGVFTASLDFGLNPYILTPPLWLQITADGVTLPRQPMTGAPFSLSTRGMLVEPDGDVGFGVSTIPGSSFFEVRDPSALKGMRTFNFPGRLTAGVFNEGSLDGALMRFSGRPDGSFWDVGQDGDSSFRINDNANGTFFRLVNGRAGIGPGSPGAALHINKNGSDDGLRITNGSTEVFNIGTLGEIRGANVSHRFGGGTGFSNVLLNLSAETWDFGLNISGGDAGKPGGGSWANTSDVRLKKNIHDLDGALDTLLALRGVTYEYKDPEAIGELDGVRTGFIAQEVEEVIPDWVWEAQDGYKRVTIRGFEALTVEALRELEAENEELRSRLAALESGAPATVLTSSMAWPLVGACGVGLIVTLRRRQN